MNRALMAAVALAERLLDGQAGEIAPARALEERPIDIGSGDDRGGTDAGRSVGSDGW